MSCNYSQEELLGSSFYRGASPYTRLGFYVFPVAPRTKKPLCDGGHNSATTNPAILAEWGWCYPSANIGIAPHLSGHFVVDVDPRNFGDESLASLPPLLHTVTALTGGGGQHYWFKRPETPGELPKDGA